MAVDHGGQVIAAIFVNREDDVEAAYQVIAQALMTTCPSNFDQARMVAQVGEDWSEIRYDCDAQGKTMEGIPGDVLTSSRVDDVLKDLRKQWPGPPWSRCTFTLFPNGEFKFDVAYDD